MAPVHAPVLLMPGEGRFARGAWFYKYAKDGVRSLACGRWMTFCGDPFYDLDAQVSDDCAVYPNPEGDADTPAFEELRESIDDFRYLWMLDRLVEGSKRRLEAEFVEPTHKGEELLAGVLKQTDDARSRFPLLKPPVRFEDRRLSAAEIIRQLLAAGAELP
jgi:hypothetical protein